MTGYEKAFELTALTAAINGLPFTPFRLGQLGLFQEQGLATTTAKIEELNGSLSILSTAPRGSEGNPVLNDKRKEYTFSIPHIPARGGISADELQNVRAFGSESALDTVTAARDRVLMKLRRSLELTLEAHRVGALKGQVLDADTSVLLNLFTTFGVSQQTQGMALTTSTTKVKDKVQGALEKLEDQLGGTPYTGIRVLCGSAFFSAISNHEGVEKFWLNAPQAAGLAASNPLMAIDAFGITWERYRGVTGCAIGDDDAYMIPLGIPDLFITRFAPADYVEAVNTMGLPMYAKAEPRRMGKGYDIEAQSNPLCLCTRPSAIVKLTKV